VRLRICWLAGFSKGTMAPRSSIIHTSRFTPRVLFYQFRTDFARRAFARPQSHDQLGNLHRGGISARQNRTTESDGASRTSPVCHLAARSRGDDGEVFSVAHRFSYALVPR
jgi:hypothetical protein